MITGETASGPGSSSGGAPRRRSLRDLVGFARSYVIYSARPWRARERAAFYKRLVKPGDLCFDIGAHLGNHTAAFLAAGCRVVAVEPQPQFAAYLRGLYGARPGVTVLDKAVGKRKGPATLQISSLAPTVTSASPRWIEEVKKAPAFANVVWDRTAEIEMTTLDALIQAHGLPAFCKIDVEGSEADVLTGLSQPLPQLCFEFVPAAMTVALACLRRLGKLGDYRYNVSIGERPRFVLPDWSPVEALRTVLNDRDPGSRSGDIYARLV